MFPILLFVTTLFWLTAILQASILPFWIGDFIFLLLFIWSLYIREEKDKIRMPIVSLWIPSALGMGMASFLFYSNWVLLPYLITNILFTALISKRSKWIFRWKEGFMSFLFIFIVFVLAVVGVRLYVTGYILTIDFGIRFLTTFIAGCFVWTYFVAKSKRNKIR